MAATDNPFVRRTRLAGWGFVLCLYSMLGGITLFCVTVTFGALIGVGVGIPVTLLTVPILRNFADGHRLWAGRLMGVRIPRPYREPRTGSWMSRLATYIRDPATWRDLAWLLVNATAGFTLAILPLSLLGSAAFYLVYPLLLAVTPPDVFTKPFGLFALTSWPEGFWMLPVAAGVFALFWYTAEPLMLGYARLTRWLLKPAERQRLAERVAELAESRAETVDSQAAELRRIERDLHDGAQARLVALGMSLGMAEELLATDPAAAQELLTEARESSGRALSELRDLVRGIHPPVLADRGLDGAVRALALASRIPVEVTIDLPGRPPAPVESAMYFAVAETLTNVAKHSGATSAWIRLTHTEDRLGVMIGDDGRGGASVEPGGGLHGVERRLAAFDGAMTVASPLGGPTIVTMELPCQLAPASS